MTATWPAISSGGTSGVGFAIAKTIASSAIAAARRRPRRRPGPDSPMKTSAPRSASSAVPAKPSRVRVLGVPALRTRRGPSRPRWIAPVRSHADDVADAGREQHVGARDARRADADDHDRHVLGPLVDDAQRVEERGEDDDRRPVLVVVEDRDVELAPAAGARSRSSAGAEMSSRLMPPKPGAIALTVRTISSTSFVARQIGNASTPPNSLNSIALPSITGIAASGPMSPSPSTAVPSVTTATVLRLIVSVQSSLGRPRRSRGRRARRRACRPSRGRRAC